MKRPFSIFIIRHAVDGALLAMRRAPQSGSTLVVLTIGSPDLVALLGATPSRLSPTLADFLTETGTSRLPVITNGAQKVSILFPHSAATTGTPQAELLDRLRTQADPWEQISLVLPYERLEVDLPPLGPDDQVTCFWEVRDLVTESQTQNFSYLAERIENERPRFEGLRFYTREPGNLQLLEDRKELIESTAGLQPSMLIQL
ncbi:MAG TPA: hypothetical protein PLB18_01460 [Acidobacteriota bacterium]|nr:hypothetical protein [Acidobacteriota bacterium]HNB70414.1 hypothetical protein [Acidobacteriota bacterium]HND18009.1 hypothetical protein [Acidobacteriota bacterium]HNG92226.1 hypothetical protein [Acidobacteriota bacterium]HNH81157.1 hypothetical protein [Acidobacteriota bacterium]